MDTPCSENQQKLIVVTGLCYNASMRSADDPLLKRFRATLDEIYGQRLEHVMLYGSRARGDAREDSDYDVAVFLRDMPDRSPNCTGWPTSAPPFLPRPALSFTL